MSIRILQGDVRERLRDLPAESVDCVVTSPPYWGLRDYGIAPSIWGGREGCEHEWGEYLPPHHPGQVEQTKWKAANAAGSGGRANNGRFCHCGAWLGVLGLEPTPEMFVEHIVEVFRGVWRVLKKQGTCWINLGDSYAGSGGAGGDYGKGGLREGQPKYPGRKAGNLKAKDLCMVPARVALALQDDGWWLRSEISLIKVAPMPESVTDRPTSATEKLFLLTKQSRYYYDQEAVRVPHSRAWWTETVNDTAHICTDRNDGGNRQGAGTPAGRNLWNWWEWRPEPSSLNHYASFPAWLPRTCILAGSSEKGNCPKCGRAWKRVMEKKPMVIARSGRREAMGEQGRTQASGTMVAPAESITTGWQPSCTCNAGEPVRAVVLDPFAGSGTALMVADRLGRDAIGIELNESYCQMSKFRIEHDAPMLVEVTIE